MKRTEQIWRQYHEGMRDFILSRVGDEAASDDILQEVFIRVHTRIDSLKDDGKIRSWIYRIARNAIVDHYRSQKNTSALPEGLAAAEDDATDRTRGEIESWLVPMIQTLPEPYRQALLLSEIDGFTQKEVAQRQKLSLSGAKSRIQRGRGMLKKLLVDCCRFEFDHRGKVIDWEKKPPQDDCC